MEILKKTDFLFSWIRSCSVCRLSAPPINWLCSGCWRRLKSFYLPPEDMIRQENEWTHLRLLDWNGKNDFFVRLFLSSLKKGGPSFMFRQLSLEFLQRAFHTLSIPEQGVFIPAPARKRDLRDHAFLLAFCLSRLAGLKMLNPLCRGPVSLKSQKQKNRQERKELCFDLKEGFSDLKLKELVKNQPIIFIDDILTTGATARAAHKALGAPKKFSIFTLAHRPLYQE